MKFLSLSLSAALLLGGCASTEYKEYADAQANISIAKHNADAEKYKAMATIAASGDSSAKVAAVMAMALSSQSGQPTAGNMAAPQTSSALQWAQLLVPSMTQMVAITQNTRLGMTQSDNAASVSRSTNDAFVGIAGKIQGVSNATTTTTTTTDSHNTSTTTDNHSVNPTPVQIPAGKVCTVSTTGLLTCQ